MVVLDCLVDAFLLRVPRIGLDEAMPGLDEAMGLDSRALQRM